MNVRSEIEHTLDEPTSERAKSFEHQDLHVVVECDSPLSTKARHCLDDVDEVIIGRGAERTFRRDRRARRLTLTIPDSLLSTTHAALRRIDGRWIMEDVGARNGCHVGGRRVERAELDDGTAIELGHTFFLFRSRWVDRPITSSLDTNLAADSGLLVTLNHELEAVRNSLLTIARSGVPIMLVGEIGTGKARFARTLHDQEKKGQFVPVNCGLMTASGAGSDVSIGAPAEHFAKEFARASLGTLFLRDLAELGASDQLALLRVLDGSATGTDAPRRGPHEQSIVSSIECSSSTLPPDTRVRRDLWAHLAGFTVRIPALRERREDLGAIVAAMLREILGTAAKRATLHPELVRAWLAHDWPFNLQELENSLRASVALAKGGRIRWASTTLRPGARDDAPPEADAEPEMRDPETRETETGDPEADVAAAPRIHASPPEADFVQNVRRALRSNLSIAGLQNSPLLGSAMVAKETRPAADATETVPALRQIVLSAIDSMRATARGERHSQVLQLTFITPAATQHEAADRLAMAFGTYRRHVTSALSELISILWFRELCARAARDRPRGDPPVDGATTP